MTSVLTLDVSLHLNKFINKGRQEFTLHADHYCRVIVHRNLGRKLIFMMINTFAHLHLLYFLRAALLDLLLTLVIQKLSFQDLKINIFHKYGVPESVKNMIEVTKISKSEYENKDSGSSSPIYVDREKLINNSF